MLLRIEKYPHRMNFAKGILEARKQHYRHLKSILKPLPLNAPTELELRLGESIRVTLLDANHCPGAVMFLIEGSGKAVLYTGDIRAETWWVNSIVRNPVVLPFACGLQQLDCIYLDTTFASHEDIYRNFPSKEDGLKELLHKIQKYPPETIFYFRAWTLGYEDVWSALACALRSTIHVNSYQMALFDYSKDGLASEDSSNGSESSALVGFYAGNHWHPGYLSLDVGSRIHSCEPGLECHSRISKSDNIVWITPIISRTPDGTEIQEVGAGGGWRDVHPIPELDSLDEALSGQLAAFCQRMIHDQELLDEILEVLKISVRRRRIPLEGFNIDPEAEITIKQFLDSLPRKDIPLETRKGQKPSRTNNNIIHFPYSRHSSYEELRDLITRFKPKDICPNTVDLDSWTEELSMQSLFGDICAASTEWYYDKLNRNLSAKCQEELALLGKRKRDAEDDRQGNTQRTASTDDGYETADQSFDERSRHIDSQMNSKSHASQMVPPVIDLTVDAPADHLEAIKTAFHKLNNGSDVIKITRPEPNGRHEKESNEPDRTSKVRTIDALREAIGEEADSQSHQSPKQESQISLSTSAFDSQTSQVQQDSTALRLDGSHGVDRSSVKARKNAYRVARSISRGPDDGRDSSSKWKAWEDLGSITGLGRPSHAELEEDLGTTP